MKLVLHILCWAAMLGSGAGMIAAVLMVDTIKHPHQIQGIIAGLGIVMVAAAIGMAASRPKNWIINF